MIEYRRKDGTLVLPFGSLTIDQQIWIRDNYLGQISDYFYEVNSKGQIISRTFRTNVKRVKIR